jgi:reactive intermediate/imine deaminase
MAQTFPLSPYRKAGNIVFVSGQVGVKDGELVEGGVQAECTQTVENIKAILEGAGLSLSNVVSAEIFLSNFAEDYGPMNEVYKELFAEPYPARICVGVKELPRSARIEIKVIAAAD